MQQQPMLPGCGGHLLDLLDGPDLAPAAIVRVFEAHQPGAREVLVGGPKRGFHIGAGEDAPLAVDAAAHHPAEHRGRAALVVIQVGVGFHEDLIARLGVAADGQLVGHGSGRGIERGFLAEQGGGLGLKLLDGRVVAEHVVTYFCLRHRLAHGRRRFGDRVAAQVNQFRRLVQHGGIMDHPGACAKKRKELPSVRQHHEKAGRIAETLRLLQPEHRRTNRGPAFWRSPVQVLIHSAGYGSAPPGLLRFTVSFAPST